MMGESWAAMDPTNLGVQFALRGNDGQSGCNFAAAFAVILVLIVLIYLAAVRRTGALDNL